MLAKWFYGFVEARISAFVHRATDAYFDEVVNYIANGKKEPSPFSTFKNNNLERANSFLGTLDTALVHVAKEAKAGRASSGTFPGKVRKAMEQPKNNDDQSPDMLYREFMRNVLKAGSGGSRFKAWFYEALIGRPEAIVESILDSCISSLKSSDGFSEPINELLLYCLNQAEEALVAPSDVDAEQPDPTALFSDTRKEQLSTLVKNLLNVLVKDKAQGNSKLAEHTDPRDSFIFTENLIQAIGQQIGVALETFVKEDLLYMLVYKSFEAAHSAYDVPEPSLSSEGADQRLAGVRTERQVGSTAENIIERVVSKVIENQAKYGTLEQEETNKIVADLRLKTQKLINEDIRNAFEWLQRVEDPSQTQPTVKKALDKINAFRDHCLLIDADVKKRFSKTNGDAIRLRIQEIMQELQPLEDKLIKIKIQISTLHNLYAIYEHLRPLRNALAKIDNDSDDGNAQLLEEIDSHIKALFALAPDLATLKKELLDDYCLMLIELREQFSKDTRDIEQVTKDMWQGTVKKSWILNELVYRRVTRRSIRNAVEETLESLEDCVEKSKKILIAGPFVSFNPLGNSNTLYNLSEGLLGGPVASRIMDRVGNLPKLLTRTEYYPAAIRHMGIIPNNKHERDKQR